MMERKMKDSGIPWIGEIPEEWDVKPIGKLFSEVYNINSKLTENNPLQFKMGTIISKLGGDSKYHPETLEGYNIVYPGVIMINGLNLCFDLISQRIGLVKENGVITSTYLAIAPKKGLDSRYYTYLFKAYDNMKVFHSLGKGLRATLTFSILRIENAIVPSLEEQTKIASWLDEKCSAIDELIDVEQKMIEELEEYRKATISETVTIGLNSGAPMSKTNIFWIPKIPSHWKICRLKDLCQQIQAGDSLTSMQINNSGKYKVYGGNGVRGYYEKSNFTGEAIIIGRQGALSGNVHYINDSIWATDHAVITTPSKISHIKYLYYLAIGMNLNQYASQTAAQPGLAVGQIKNVLTINPPLEEQQAIADYLDTKCKEIDDLIAVKREKIETLKQYRQSLIFEAVTGKIQLN